MGSTTQFDRTTTLQPHPTAPNRFDVELHTDWSSHRGVHGGYQCALAVRAAKAFVPDRDVRTLSTSFLRAAQVGSAQLEVHEVRRSRSLSTVTVELRQNGELLTLSRVSLVDGRSGIDWSTLPPLEPPPPEACIPFEAPPEVGHYHRAQGLLDPATQPYGGGEEPSLSGYLRPLEGRPIDAAWLAMAVDWFPPAAFVRLGERPTFNPAPDAPRRLPSGVSVDLIVHFHQTNFAVGDDWLAISFSAAASSGGLAVEHGRIVKRDGT